MLLYVAFSPCLWWSKTLLGHACPFLKGPKGTVEELISVKLRLKSSLTVSVRFCMISN